MSDVLYCKAYLTRDLAKFDGWRPDLSNLLPTTDPQGELQPRTALQDDDILFLHQDFSVTDGAFLGEHVVFHSDDDTWQSFCREVLSFAIPDDVQAMARAGAAPQPAETAAVAVADAG